VIDPELGDDIVNLGMVPSVDVGAGGDVSVTVALTVAGCPLRSQIERDVRGRVLGMPGVTSVDVIVGEMDAAQKSEVMDRARWKARQDAPVTAVSPTTRVLAVASGKGGVGKSSVSPGEPGRGAGPPGLDGGCARCRYLGLLGAAATGDRW
jgi:ATP-binding protein involved in chromosome partitioning